MNKRVNKYLCLLILVIPIILGFTYSMRKECDIWFLLSHGRYVLNNGFPHTDFLSMHSDFHFVMQQWLSSVIFYLAYKFLGSIGVYLIVWISNLLIVFLLYKLNMKISNNNLLIACFMTIIISLLLGIAFVVSRPITFSLIVYILLLYIMESYRKKKSKIVYLLIPLSLLEINLHASMWPVLFILLLPYLVYYFYLYIKEKNKFVFKLFLIVVLMFLVGFINPYGIENMTYSFRSYGIYEINSFIWEMNGLNFSSKYAYVKFFSYITLLCMVGVTYLFIRSKKEIEIYKLLLFYGTYFMALCNIRNTSIFFICGLIFCSEYIVYKAKYIEKFNKKYIVLYLIAFIALVSVVYSNRNGYILSDEYIGMKKVANYLDKVSSKDDPIYTNTCTGTYFSYRGYKTYIDTRAEVYLKVNNHKENTFYEFYKLVHDNTGYKEFLDKYNFKHLIIVEDEPFNRYLKTKDNDKYHVVYKSGEVLLYERIDD